MTATHENTEGQTVTSHAWRWVQIVFSGLALLFALGFLTGTVVAALDTGSFTTKAIIYLLSGFLVIAASAYWLFTLQPFAGAPGPISPRTKRASLYLMLAGALGGLLSLGLAIGGGIDGGVGELFSNAPLPRTLAIVLALIYLVGVPIIGWQWHRSIDEHEAAANSQGALAGIYAYSLIAPVWWLGERAGILPSQEPMIVFIVVMAVWGVVWAVKRSG